MRLVARFAPLFVVLAAFARAQELPPPQDVPAGIGPAMVVQLPAAHDGKAWAPLLVLWSRGGDLPAARAAIAAVGVDAARVGYVVVAPAVAPAAAAGQRLAPWFAELRRTHRIAGGGLHAATTDDVVGTAALLLAHRHQFQSVTLLTAANESDLAGLKRLPARTITVLADADAAARQRHFAALHGARALAGPAAAIAQALDDFHDAAANGDEDRYFALLPDDAVFLGTDASERWTGAEFRRFALPYFQRPEAWTYVPLQRHVTVLQGGEHACFDELLDNDGYGICRGSGVLVRRDERWVLQLYDLSIPMPNDLAAAFAQRIRAFVDGQPAPVTTVILVRHAEKGADGDDPELTEAGRARAEALVRTLRDVPIDAVWHSEYRRTALTVAPLCTARSLQPTVAKAADSAALARTLDDFHDAAANGDEARYF
ncbi:MAG: nuclear transport factor 2 family protein, partial [Planctomycetes bacterium]|nr:nuclear transport factor 2 family protein [Planctomycetota bacterium]